MISLSEHPAMTLSRALLVMTTLSVETVLTWIGASDGIEFAHIMSELVAQTRDLGPMLPDLRMVI